MLRQPYAIFAVSKAIQKVPVVPAFPRESEELLSSGGLISGVGYHYRLVLQFSLQQFKNIHLSYFT